MIRHRGVARRAQSTGTPAEHMGVRDAKCCIVTYAVT
jgi:hypothetical protein